MTTITFNTLRFANRLKSAGVPDKQAEAEAEALAEVFETGTIDLATKADLREYESVIRNDLEKLETGLRGDMEKLELRMHGELTQIRGEMKLMKWMLGVIVLSVVPLAIKTFLHS